MEKLENVFFGGIINSYENNDNPWVEAFIPQGQQKI